MASFINPYTFVPTGKGKKQNINEYYSNGELLSGRIDCTLITRKELSICEKETDNQFGFFSIDGKPVIPGSSIRGVIRSVYETLTDSCFSSTNAEDDDYFSSRLNKDKCGLLKYEDGQYVLYRAQRYKDENNSQLYDFKEGEEVSFSSYNSSSGKILYFNNVNGNGADKKGYVHKVNRFKGIIKGKRIENLDSIFEQIGNSGTPVDKEYFIRLEENVAKSDKKPAGYEALLENIKKRQTVVPVWYCEYKGHYYFAPSQMSRTVFYKKPIDILEDHGLEKCSKKEEVCEACALFGMIGGDNSYSVSSRLRFTDAVCPADNCLEEGYRTVIMGSPRLSSFEFYLRCEKQSFCADDEGVNIAGRKFFWHKNSKGINDIPPEEISAANEKMRRRIKLAKPGSRFRFSVFFDNITEEQLRKLVFTLTLGENSPESDHCHKIGHGKPLGLGSAKIVCDKITLRKFSYPEYKEDDITSVAEEDNKKLFSNQRNMDCILKVTDINAVDGRLISYPHPEGSKDIFKWFANNRETLKELGKPLEYKQKLPKLMAKNQEMMCGAGSGGKNNNDKNSNRQQNQYNGGSRNNNHNNKKDNSGSGGNFFNGIRIKDGRK